MSIDWKRMHENVKRAAAILDAAHREMADLFVDNEPSEIADAVTMGLALGVERVSLAASGLERLAGGEPAFKRSETS